MWNLWLYDPMCFKQQKTSNMEDIREYIANNQLGKALEMLKELVKDDRELLNNVILLTARYKQLERETLSGIISKADENLQRNKITHSLLSYIDIAEKEIRKK